MLGASTSNGVAFPNVQRDAAGAVRSFGCYSDALGPYDSQVDLSIVIVNWNTKDLLRACLDSIASHAGPVRHEVIVVDNGSSDGSSGMVAREFPHVRVLVNQTNTGFAVANNQGLACTHGRYTLLLNSDTIVTAGAFAQMVRYMDEHPRFGALGPRLLNEDRSEQLSVFPFPNILHDVLVTIEINRWPLVGALTRWYGQRRDVTMSAQTGPVDYVLGACIMFRREALEQVGVLDQKYFFGGEEMDLCYRLRQQGWLTVYQTEAEVVHLHGGSRKALTATYLMWYHRAKLRFYRLHHAYWQYVAMRVALALSALGHMIVLGVHSRQSLQRRSILSAYARLLVRAAGW